MVFKPLKKKNYLDFAFKINLEASTYITIELFKPYYGPKWANSKKLDFNS